MDPGRKATNQLTDKTSPIQVSAAFPITNSVFSCIGPHLCQTMDDDQERLDPSEHGQAEDHKAFVLKLQGHTLVGHTNEDDNAAVQMGRQRDHVYLKKNEQLWKDEFELAQLSFAEFHYRGASTGKRDGHSMESRALLLMLALMPCLRQAKANVKAAALKLLSALISAMVSMAGECLRFHATIFGSDWQYHSKEIVFTHGATDGFGRPILTPQPCS